MKKLLFKINLVIFILLIFITILNKPVTNAQEEIQTPSPTKTIDNEKKYNIIYPIIELGNCTDKQNCREFCDNPLNQTACVEYAEKKGFYNQKKEREQKRILLEKAKIELNCTDIKSCKALCDQPKNKEKCQSFFQKWNPEENKRQNEKINLLLIKAKEMLGCNSIVSCKKLCQLDENKEKCSQLANPIQYKGNKKDNEKYCQLYPEKCSFNTSNTKRVMTITPQVNFGKKLNNIRNKQDLKTTENPEVKGISTQINREQILIQFFLNKLINILQ